MSADKHKPADHDKAEEKSNLKMAQVELVKLQRHVIATGQQVPVILEGRDAARKDGTIKRIVRLTRREFGGRNHKADLPDPEIAFGFHADAIANRILAQ